MTPLHTITLTQLENTVSLSLIDPPYLVAPLSAPIIYGL